MREEIKTVKIEKKIYVEGKRGRQRQQKSYPI